MHNTEHHAITNPYYMDTLPHGDSSTLVSLYLQ